MKPQKRIPVKSGSARVDKDCPAQVIKAVRKMAKLAYKQQVKTST